jgi:hypothetical protein
MSDEDLKEVDPNSLRERLAALEHEQWSHWTRHMLRALEPHLRLGRALSVELAMTGKRTPKMIEASICLNRWKRQMATPYAELTEKEKDSDREWADKVMLTMAGIEALVEGLNLEEPAPASDGLAQWHCPECAATGRENPMNIPLYCDACLQPLGSGRGKWIECTWEGT